MSNLGYVSGRNLASVRDAMRLYALPRPDFVIADRDAIKSMLTGVDGLRAQEPAKQERFKLSFYVPLYLGPAAVKAGIGDRLQPRRDSGKADLRRR